jgi:hypothetical protein
LHEKVCLQGTPVLDVCCVNYFYPPDYQVGNVPGQLTKKKEHTMQRSLCEMKPENQTTISPEETTTGLILSVGEGELAADVAKEFRRAIELLYLQKNVEDRAKRADITITLTIAPSKEQVDGMEICSIEGSVKRNMKYERKRKTNVIVLSNGSVKSGSRRF